MVVYRIYNETDINEILNIFLKKFPRDEAKFFFKNKFFKISWKSSQVFIQIYCVFHIVVVYPLPDCSKKKNQVFKTKINF